MFMQCLVLTDLCQNIPLGVKSKEAVMSSIFPSDLHMVAIAYLTIDMGNLRNHKRKSKMTNGDKDLLSSHSKPESASARKLNFVHVIYSDSEGEHFQASCNGYRIWDWGQLQTLISNSFVCKFCGSDVELDEQIESR